MDWFILSYLQKRRHRLKGIIFEVFDITDLIGSSTSGDVFNVANYRD